MARRSCASRRPLTTGHVASATLRRDMDATRPSPRARSRGPPGHLDLTRAPGRAPTTSPSDAPAADAEGVFSSPKGDPRGSRARAPRLHPRLHDRRRRRPDQPARHPPDAGRGPGRTGSSRAWASRPPMPRTGRSPRSGWAPSRDVLVERPAGPRPGRRRLPAVAGVADRPFRPDRGGDRRDRAPRATPARTCRSSA